MSGGVMCWHYTSSVDTGDSRDATEQNLLVTLDEVRQHEDSSSLLSRVCGTRSARADDARETWKSRPSTPPGVVSCSSAGRGFSWRGVLSFYFSVSSTIRQERCNIRVRMFKTISPPLNAATADFHLNTHNEPRSNSLSESGENTRLS